MSDKKIKQRVSIGNWIITLLLSAIPAVNLILWFVWLSGAKQASKRTFAAACLILTLIFIAAAALCISLWGAQLLEWARSLDPNAISQFFAP